MTAPEEHHPSHPDLFTVCFQDGAFSSFLRANKEFKAGETIVPLVGLTKGPKAYSSVQCGPGPEDHVELNSDLLYLNHSCDPNVVFDLSSPDQTEWHARAIKDIYINEPMTFFYPSTEWSMAQPFDCTCGSKNCLGCISGASALSEADLTSRGFANPWILGAICQRDASEKKGWGCICM